MAFYKLKAGKSNGVLDQTQYIGTIGHLFYSPDDNILRISDGHTPGGKLAFIPPATASRIGGIKAGPGAVVAADGTLSIDATGLPLSVGDFVFSTNNITSVNANEDININSNGTGTVNVVGDFHVHATGLGGLSSPPVLQVKADGQIKMLVPLADSTTGALEIVGALDGTYQTPVNTGVMLHVTGNPSQGSTATVSRIYNDSQGTYSLYVGRRYNGTATNPTPVLAGQDIARFAGNGYTSSGWQPIGPARMTIKALENLTGTAQGSQISFEVTPIGSTYSSIVTATTITATGTTSLNFFGPLTGNVTGLITTAAQPNITSVGTLTSLTVNNGGVTSAGAIRYDVGQNNGTVTQLTDKSTTVICNGLHGQITTAASSIAKGAAVTFTVTNSAITAVTDVPVVAFQSGATANAYAVAVTRVQVGSFNITINNNGNGALADTIIINFAIIKVS